MIRPDKIPGKKRTVRTFAPLALGLIALLILIPILPSALNLPRSNPSQTLEYAPIAEDSESESQDGNIASLGVGGGRGFGEAHTRQNETASTGPGRGSRPSTKKCVGNPPRQTEDPLSPPCVAFFEGNNFGATHRGVSRDEIRVLLYFEDSPQDAGKIFDMNEPVPPGQTEHFRHSDARVYQRYFNDRFQTYGRAVHFFVHHGAVGGTPEARRADAAQGIAEVRPFAVIAYPNTNGPAYYAAMAEAGAVTFLGNKAVYGSSTVGEPAEFFRRRSGFAWSYEPSRDLRAKLIASHLCRKVVPHSVSFSGNNDFGQRRVLGLLRTDNPSFDDLSGFAKLIRDEIENCGGKIQVERTFPNPGAGFNCTHAGGAQNGAENMAAFSQSQPRVTTIIWAGGHHRCQTQAAAAIQYRPEWVVAGDGGMDQNWFSRQSDQSVWQHARAVSLYPRRGSALRDDYCGLAAREADPARSSTQAALIRLCHVYNDYRQLFTGIQVAGPRLTPESIDKGFHAIPAVPSKHPEVPACFYDLGDYTCVKDAQAQWWDPSGDDPHSNNAGCWRSMESGRRYLTGSWPEGDIDKQKGPSDLCNAQGVPDISTLATG